MDRSPFRAGHRTSASWGLIRRMVGMKSFGHAIHSLMIVRMSQPDLDAIERDLNDVEQSLERLDAGTYFTDEVTGAPIPESVLAERPTSRHA